MSSFARTDTSTLGRWWWTVDRWTLLALGLLIAFGLILTMAASPAAGGRIGLDGFHLAKRQLVLIPLAAAILFGTSLLSVKQVRRLAVIGFLGSIVMLVATLFLGTEIKGAVRCVCFTEIRRESDRRLRQKSGRSSGFPWRASPCNPPSS